MGKGSSGGGVNYSQSPANTALTMAMLPVVQKAATAAMTNQPLYPTIDLLQGQYQAPSTSNYLNTLSNYSLPTPNMALPSKAWWENLSPQIMAGVNAPWDTATNQYMDTLNSRGQLGNARGGVTAQGAAGLADLYSKRAQNVGLQAWQMTSPVLSADWQLRAQQAQQRGQEQYLGAGQAQDYRNWLNNVALQNMMNQQASLSAPYSATTGLTGAASGIPTTAQAQPSFLNSAMGGLGLMSLMGGSGGIGSTLGGIGSGLKWLGGGIGSLFGK